MLLKAHEDLVNTGGFERTKEWRRAWSDVKAAIEDTDWPHGTGKFLLYPESGKKRGCGNGVVPIKLPCIRYLKTRGWATEELPDVEPGVLECGDLDALLDTPRGPIAFEWETGNISSSHRAINKLLLTFLHGRVVGGVLVVPSDKMKGFLTDRIGNIGELRPYFPLWRSAAIPYGVLRIAVVEQDATSLNVPRIPKGKDGRALG
jgi:hypothetical protein